MSTLILSSKDVAGLLDPGATVEAVEDGFRLHGEGKTRMPSKVYLPLPEHEGDFRAMPVYIPGAAPNSVDGGTARAGVKWINAHPQNPARHGLPAVIGVFILSNPETALPLAVMDATELTHFRTGAAAAVATKHLARADARTLGIIGCGAQAPAVLQCHGEVRRFEEIRLHDAVGQKATSLAERCTGLPCRTSTLEEAAGADVICTLTPSRSPFVMRAMLRPGTHVNALGADAPGKQELESRIICDAAVYLDDIEQASESGEVNVPLKTGDLATSDIAGTLGQVVAGIIRGRSGEDEITVFDSTGLAVQDLAVATNVYEAARELGIGHETDLVGA
jgi:ornithine cyclodeaminase/alanine dehydrogenase